MKTENKRLAVTAFAGFSIVVLDGADAQEVQSVQKPSKGHPRKPWQLMAYLIFSGKESATVEELIELIWPEKCPSNPLAALRLVVHRARAELDEMGVYKGEELILHQENSYSWNKKLPIITDVGLFDKLYDALFKTNQYTDSEQRLDILLKAIRLYRGRFLPTASQQQWTTVLDTYYHAKYMLMCERALVILPELGRTTEIVALCKACMAIDPYAENLHIAFMKALAKVGAHTAALDHYKRITAMFLDEFGLPPSEEFRAVYGMLTKSTNEQAADIDTIRRALDDEGSAGALFLEYETFKQVYQLKMRESMRSGQKAQLALISVVPSGGKTPGPRSKRTCMERMGEVIRTSLRQGDLYARYSPLQYLILLQGVDANNGEKIIQRIDRAFDTAHPRSGYLLQFPMLPLLPKVSK